MFWARGNSRRAGERCSLHAVSHATTISRLPHRNAVTARPLTRSPSLFSYVPMPSAATRGVVSTVRCTTLHGVAILYRLFNRKVKADRLNQKGVTDISYIHTAQGVLYLSIIRDLCDNSIVACKTSKRKKTTLVLETLRLAVETIRSLGELLLNSDQGFQCTSHACFALTKQYGITPSMSRWGNCYDNVTVENLFSILKIGCIYRQKI